MRFIDDQERYQAFPNQAQKPFVLNPFRRHIEKLETLETETLDDLISLLLGQTGVKGRGGDVALFQTLDLILHQGDEWGHHEGQPRQERRRKLIAKRFPLAGRHDDHRIATSQDSPPDIFLTRPELIETELLSELLL
jgi:hypothetical protein